MADDYRVRLIAARERLGLSRREMAARLLTPPLTYEQWEVGKRGPPGVAVLAAEIFAAQPQIGRNARIASRAVNGETYEKIGADYRISKQRVEQIVKRFLGGSSPRRTNPPRFLLDFEADVTRKTVETLVEVREAAGLPVKPPRKKKRSKYDLDKGLQLIREGLSVYEAAQAIAGAHAKSVMGLLYKMRDAAGLPPRKRGRKRKAPLT